jgi:hypothetical protein
MIAELQPLLDETTCWIKDKTVLRQVDDLVEVTTPYLDRHNDYLQIYVQRRNGRVTGSERMKVWRIPKCAAPSLGCCSANSVVPAGFGALAGAEKRERSTG